MAQTIKLKRSGVQGNAPDTTDLALGEVAINTYDGKVFIKKDDGSESIVEIGAEGPKGQKGEVGVQGTKGEPSTVVGPTGPKGDTGPTGSKGQKGDVGGF